MHIGFSERLLLLHTIHTFHPQLQCLLISFYDKLLTSNFSSTFTPHSPSNLSHDPSQKAGLVGSFVILNDDNTILLYVIKIGSSKSR